MPILLDSYFESSPSYDRTGYADGPETGQSFAGMGARVTSAKFYCEKNGSPTGNAYAKIYAHSGTFGSSSVPTGAALAVSGPFDVSTLTTSYALIELTFSGAQQIPLLVGMNYVLTIEYTGGDASNYILIGCDSTSPTHAGNMSYYNTPGPWGAIAGFDMSFYLYGETILDYWPESNFDSRIYLEDTFDGISQSFAGMGAIVTGAAFYGAKGSGSPTGNVYAKIYAHSGTFGADGLPTGTALAVSDPVDAAALPTFGGITLIPFAFSGAARILLASGTNYALTVEHADGDVDNFIGFGVDVASPEHPGNLGLLYDAGGWIYPGAQDLIFYLFGGPPPDGSRCPDFAFLAL